MSKLNLNLKSQQFKQRILTAFVLVILTVVSIIWLPPFAFSFLTAAFFGLAAWEWAKLMGLRKQWQTITYVVLFFLCCYFSFYISIPILLLAVAWWFIALFFLINYPKFRGYYLDNKIIACVIGLLLLVPAWLSLNLLLRLNSFNLLIMVLLIVWSVDTGAFFVGRRWGKHKLAKQVSPGKTIEGLCGGIALAIIVMIIIAWLFKFHLAQWPALILLAILTAFAAVVGDLFESMIKRLVGVKDSGGILPGHGGVLDRIDSLTAALPIFYVIAMWLH